MIRRGLVAVLALGATGTARAQEVRDTLRLGQAVRLARAANPMLRAARFQGVAAAERIGPAGALPDPQLTLGFANRMLSGLSDVMDPMTMDEIRVSQTIPWPGKLGSARQAARHRSVAAAADAEEQARMLEAEVRMAYFELAAADRAVPVMERTRMLLREFQNIATTMYAVGSAVQQDVLRAQVEVARMSGEIVRMRRERIASAARLNTLLGRPATTPVEAIELPGADLVLPDADTLIAIALQARPALRAGVERVAAAEASLAAVRRDLLPDLELGLSYQRRPAFPDMASVMIGFTLPLFAGTRQLPMRREMAAMRDMVAAELEAQRLRTSRLLVELRARAVQDAELVRLYRSSVLPQSAAAVQAALGGYRVGQVTFMALVDNQMTVNRYEIEIYRLLADYHQAIGEIEALTGPLGRERS